jgi:hypothetical protein
MSSRLLAKESGTESNENPTLTAIVSTVPQSGSKTVGRILKEEFCKLGENVLLVQPGGQQHNDSKNERTFEYHASKSIVSSETIEDIVGKSVKDFDRIIFICPDLSSGLLPVRILKNLDSALVVERADRSWSEGKRLLVKEFSDLAGIKPELVLNGIRLHELDQLLVEVPKARNWLTKKIRSFAKFEFGSTVPETRNL